MAKDPVNKLANAITPAAKIPGELMYGKKTFPDVFNPKTIRDNPQYIADSLGLGAEFKAITHSDLLQSAGIKPRPSKPYLTQDTAENFLYYKVEPGQTAYYNTQEAKRDYLKKIGKGGDGDFSSPKSDALRNYKIALRLKDEAAAGYYWAEYKKYGGTKEGLQKSLETLDPLSGIAKDDRKKFKATLNQEQQNELEKANNYFKTVMLGK